MEELLEADVRGKSGSRSAISFLLVSNDYPEIRQLLFFLKDRSIILARCPVMPSHHGPAFCMPARRSNPDHTSMLVVYRNLWDGRRGLLNPTFHSGRFADSA